MGVNGQQRLGKAATAEAHALARLRPCRGLGDRQPRHSRRLGHAVDDAAVRDLAHAQRERPLALLDEWRVDGARQPALEVEAVAPSAPRSRRRRSGPPWWARTRNPRRRRVRSGPPAPRRSTASGRRASAWAEAGGGARAPRARRPPSKGAEEHRQLTNTASVARRFGRRVAEPIEEDAVPTYIMLSTLTPEGVQTVKNNPQRIREVDREVEQLGARSRRSGRRSGRSTSST